jgi:hypothetical protein
MSGAMLAWFVVSSAGWTPRVVCPLADPLELAAPGVGPCMDCVYVDNIIISRTESLFDVNTMIIMSYKFGEEYNKNKTRQMVFSNAPEQHLYNVIDTDS